MKPQYFLFLIMLAGCNAGEQQKETVQKTDTTIAEKGSSQKNETAPVPLPPVRMYSNDRFKEVTVEKTGEHKFLIKGKGQIFEANFNWVVEDGHEELKKGFQMTDAGAPEWGNFNFTIDVSKKRPNSTLTLILFESSAKDGSPQHELPILLY